MHFASASSPQRRRAALSRNSAPVNMQRFIGSEFGPLAFSYSTSGRLRLLMSERLRYATAKSRRNSPLSQNGACSDDCIARSLPKAISATPRLHLQSRNPQPPTEAPGDSALKPMAGARDLGPSRAVGPGLCPCRGQTNRVTSLQTMRGDMLKRAFRPFQL